MAVGSGVGAAVGVQEPSGATTTKGALMASAMYGSWLRAKIAT